MLLLKKLCEYRADYKNRPSNSISFMSAVPTTSGRLHCELANFIFAGSLGNRFFATSKELRLHNITRTRSVSSSGFYSHLKSKVVNILTKATALRINLNIDGAPIASHTQCVWGVPPASALSLSLHRHHYFHNSSCSRFIRYNNKQQHVVKIWNMTMEQGQHNRSQELLVFNFFIDSRTLCFTREEHKTWSLSRGSRNASRWMVLWE